MPKVSVIVPAYNAEKTLGRAVQSVQAQTLADWEMIIINDASTDSTAELARGLAAGDRRIRLVELTQNSGQSTGRNRGFEEAKGEWLAILDADDAFEPQRLEVMVGHAEARGLDMVADNQWFYDAALGVIARPGMVDDGKVRAWTVLEHYRQEMVGKRFKWGLLKPVLKRDFWKKSGLKYHPEFHMGEDSLLYGELLAVGAKADVLPTPMYVYTTARGDISGEASGFSTSRYKLEDHLVTYDYFLEHYAGRVDAQVLDAVRACRKAALDAEESLFIKRAIRQRKLLKALKLALARPGALYFLAFGLWRFARYRLPHKILRKLKLKRS